MKLKFTWYQYPGGGRFAAGCEAPIPGTDKFSLLGHIMVDEAGASHETSLKLIDDAIASVEAVRDGRSPEEQWDKGGYYCSTIRRDGVQITSPYDETLREVVSLANLERALRAWKEFLQSRPVLGLVHEVEV